MSKVPFRYTFAITKAEATADGYFLVGEASGPEIDATNERMSPQAISRFAAQITSQAENGQPLAYRDAHAQDGVLRDLGEVIEGWIDERFHLGIRVKLDHDSPSAMYLWRQVQKGKQFGMSVAGEVLDFVDEYVAEAGRTVRTYKDIMLTEISNTTRPAWTPSLGTVLSKAIDEAQAESLAKTGDTVDSEDTLTASGATDDAAPVDDTAKDDSDAVAEDDVVEKDDASEVTDEADVVKSDDDDVSDEGESVTAEKSDDAEADEASDAEVTEKAAEDEGSDIEKAGRAISASTARRWLALHQEMTSMLEDLGILSTDAPEKSDSPEPAETDLAKSLNDRVAAAETEAEELRKALAEMTARVEELEATPAVAAPPIVNRNEPTVDEALAAITKMSPSERLRLGLTLAH